MGAFSLCRYSTIVIVGTHRKVHLIWFMKAIYCVRVVKGLIIITYFTALDMAVAYIIETSSM